MKNITYNYFLKLHKKLYKVVSGYVDVDCYEQTTCDENYEYYLKEKVTEDQVAKLRNGIKQSIEEDGLSASIYEDNAIGVYGKSDTPFIEIHVYTIDEGNTVCMDISFIE